MLLPRKGRSSTPSSGKVPVQINEDTGMSKASWSILMEGLAGQMWFLVRLTLLCFSEEYYLFSVLFPFTALDQQRMRSTDVLNGWDFTVFTVLHCHSCFPLCKLLMFSKFHKESECVYSICTREKYAQKEDCAVHVRLGYFGGGQYYILSAINFLSKLDLEKWLLEQLTPQ